MNYKEEFMKILFDAISIAVKEAARKGLAILLLLIAVIGLSVALVYHFNTTREEIAQLRVECKKDVSEARSETRECEEARIAQAAQFNEIISGMKQEIARMRGQLDAIGRRVK